MRTVLLLVASNLFMTFAWYGHLRFRQVPLWQAIVASWGIAFFEYCLQVPANRFGYAHFSAFQLKILQEIITVVVFVGFALIYLREPLHWHYLVSFGLIFAAVYFAFLPKSATPRAAAQADAALRITSQSAENHTSDPSSGDDLRR